MDGPEPLIALARGETLTTKHQAKPCNHYTNTHVKASGETKHRTPEPPLCETFYATISGVAPKTIMRGNRGSVPEIQHMTHAIRFQRKNAVYLVSNRCMMNSCFFRPSEVVNEIIEEALVWAASKHEVLIYGFSFRPADYWIKMTAPKLNRQDFMRDFQSQVALKLNRHWGRTGKFFAGRYKCSHLLDNLSAWTRLCRIICAPCEADLVEHPQKWRGVSSYGMHLNGEALEVERENRTKYWRLKQKYPQMSDEEATKLATETHRLELSKLDLDDISNRDAYRRELLAAVEEEANRLAKARVTSCVGMENVEQWSVAGAPSYPVPRSLPDCAASSAGRRRRFRRQKRARRDSYQGARDGLRLGRTNVSFPAGTIPLHKSVTVPHDEGRPDDFTSAWPDPFDDWEKCG
ncbi:MAG: hypothetical protein ACQEVA_00610 [Myxococcota bacterium]